jgi:hypothetical protein
LFPSPGIYTRAGKFPSQVGYNTATPSTKYVLKTLMNYRQKEKRKAKANQKTNKRKRKTYIRTIQKENEKGEQLKICSVQ